jgi:hypothetical protein
MSGPDDLDPKDAKIVTLARSSRPRTGAAEGAAVRDLAPGAPVLRADARGAVQAVHVPEPS